MASKENSQYAKKKNNNKKLQEVENNSDITSLLDIAVYMIIMSWIISVI